jgi:hypothetical protein
MINLRLSLSLTLLLILIIQCYIITVFYISLWILRLNTRRLTAIFFALRGPFYNFADSNKVYLLISWQPSSRQHET